MMRYGSVCSGIEAATVAWHPLVGWEAAFLSEIEPFPCAVLRHHYPDVPNLGDMTKYKEWPDESIDLLVGGTPCQSFSVAGLRKGLADPRGNLMLTFGAIAQRYRPRWLVWENVPGVLSSNRGRDFATFLGTLEELGYGWAYRILDAQFFGLAQRRRRVFVVGYLGDWRRAAAVLFEPESLRGDSPPSREKGQRVAGTIKGGSGERGYPDPSDGNGGGLVGPCDISRSLTRRYGFSESGQGFWREAEGDIGPIRSQGEHWSKCSGVVCYENHAQDSRIKEHGDLSPQLNAKAGTGGNNLPLVLANGQGGAEIRIDGEPSLTCNHEAPICAYPINTLTLGGRPDPVNDARMTLGVGDDGDPQFTIQAAHSHAVAASFKPGQGAASRSIGYAEEQSPTLGAEAGGNTVPAVISAMQVRRLTPIEAERLQGFPDDYTNILTNTKTFFPEGAGHCAKQIVRATLITTKNKAFIAFNHCLNPQQECPRKDLPTGVGYNLCKDICQQDSHAEQNVIKFAGKHAQGGTLYVEGHTYTCEPCKAAAHDAGVSIVIGPPPGNAPDGPRYKALGNSMAVPVMRWIGERIQMVEGLLLKGGPK